MTLPTAHG
jgi:hypothetical protein